MATMAENGTVRLEGRHQSEVVELKVCLGQTQTHSNTDMNIYMVPFGIVHIDTHTKFNTVNNTCKSCFVLITLEVCNIVQSSLTTIYNHIRKRVRKKSVVQTPSFPNDFKSASSIMCLQVVAGCGTTSGEI